MITLLTIDPGWGGQKPASSTASRVDQTRSLIQDSGRDILLCLDGGVTRENIDEIMSMGPDLVVTGSAVYDGKNPFENARFMLERTGARR